MIIGNLEFWKNIASLWNQRNTDEDYQNACEEGRIQGNAWNQCTSSYQDDDFMDYEDEDDI